MKKISARKIITVLISLGLIYLIGKSMKVNNVYSLESALTNTEALENTYYTVQIIIGVFLCIGAIIGIWQYVLTARSERAKIKKDNIQRAIDLAGYYKDNILHELVVFNDIFEKSGIKKILDKIKPEEMRDFDVNELETVLSKTDRDEISNIMHSKEMKEILRKANRAISKKDFYCEDASATVDMKDLSSTLNAVLNNMELFAMSFTHGTADESVVYQSLHQTYVKLVQLFYYNIAINNMPNGTQYYTNVIKLYKIWYKKSRSRKDVITKNGRNIISYGNKADDMEYY